MTSHLKNTLSLVFSLLTVATLAYLSLDSFGSTDSTLRYFGIASPLLVTPFWLVWAGVRRGWGTRLHPQLARLLQWVVLPLLTLVTVVLTLIDYFSPLNTVFSYTRLHQSRLGLMVVFLLGVLLIQQTKQWWRLNWRTLLTLAPLVLFLMGLMVHLWPWNMWLEFVKEDRLVENLQFMVLALGSLWAFRSFLGHARQGFWLSAGVALGIMLCFGAVAGDEISWMQRHLGLETPAAIAEQNRQGEITFHNLYSLEWLVGYAYLGLSIFGAVSPFVVAAVFRNQWQHWRRLFPPVQTFFFFAIPALQIINNFAAGGGQYRAWAEPVELSLYTGLVLWLSGVSVQKINTFLRPQA